jgi:hypothetical protein
MSDTANVGLEKILARVHKSQMNGESLTFEKDELYTLEHILQLATVGLYRDVKSNVYK